MTWALARRRQFSSAVFVSLAVAAALAYAHAPKLGFLVFDDNWYVTENQLVQRGLTWDGARWAFFSFQSSNWHPLTWLSHMLDCQLFGLAPAGPHCVSVLIHLANSGLVFVFLRRSTGALR